MSQYPMNKPVNEQKESSGMYTEPAEPTELSGGFIDQRNPPDLHLPKSELSSRAAAGIEEMLTGNRKTRRRLMAVVKRIAKKSKK